MTGNRLTINASGDYTYSSFDACNGLCYTLVSRTSSRLWYQRDGTPIAVFDMTTRHIINAGRMLFKKLCEQGADLAELAKYPLPDSGKDGQFDVANAIDRDVQEYAIDEGWLEYFAKELLRRGVKPAWRLSE